MPLGHPLAKRLEGTRLGNSPTKDGKQTSKRDRCNERHTSPDSKCHSKEKEELCAAALLLEFKGKRAWQRFAAKVYSRLFKQFLFKMWQHYSPYSDPCGSCFSLNPRTPVAPPQPG